MGQRRRGTRHDGMDVDHPQTVKKFVCCLCFAAFCCVLLLFAALTVSPPASCVCLCFLLVPAAAGPGASGVAVSGPFPCSACPAAAHAHHHSASCVCHCALCTSVCCPAAAVQCYCSRSCVLPGWVLVFRAVLGERPGSTADGN